MNDKRPMTGAELEALPIGTIFSVSGYGADGTVWVKFSGSDAEPLSHDREEPQSLAWFASNNPLTNRIDPLFIKVVGFDPKKVVHTRGDKLRIYINRKLDISPNKRAAHAVHAALLAFGVHPGVKVVVLDKGPTVIEEMRISVHDAGHTELEPGTLTAGTNWPEDSEA